MSGMRKWLCLFFGVAFAAFAAPSFAAKLFSLSVDSNSNIIWSDSSLNTGGNSVINSVKLVVPGGVTFTITGWSNTVGTLYNYNSNTPPTNATPAVTSLPYTVPATPGGTILWIKNIAGTNPGQVFQIATTGMTSGCTGPLRFFTASAWTGNTWGGQQFGAAIAGADQAAIPCSGQLGCGTGNLGDLPNVVGDASLLPDPAAGNNGVPDWVLERDGNPSICFYPPLPFSFSFNPNGKIVNFTAPSTGGQHVWAKYTLQWSSEPVDPNTGFAPNVRPLVSYGIANPQIGTADYVPALACVDDDFGTVQADNMPIIPNIAPYNTSPYAQYQPGQVALVCISRQGWVSVGAGANALVQYWSTFIDKVDTTIIRN